MSYTGKAPSPRYSAKIKTVERLLWVSAGFAVLSVFIFGTSRPNADAFLLNNSDLLALALGEQITDPRFTGVTNSDDAFSIGATAAIPNGPRPTQVTLIEPTTSIELNSGVFVFARAEEGAFDTAARRITLEGDTIITSSDGYRIDSQAIALDLQTSGLLASDIVTLMTPQGIISAQRLDVTSEENGTGRSNLRLVFEGDVQMTLYGSQEGR